MSSRSTFELRHRRLTERQQELFERKNVADEEWFDGVVSRYRDPILTADHVPIEWRYDLDVQRNPGFVETIAINAVFNAGAMTLGDRVVLVCRVEGADRKSFFAVAESGSGVDGFRFWDRPIVMPRAGSDETNHYDMRLTQHEDGWIYGTFCVERKDPDAPPGDLSSALASCGIARTKDLVTWERLPDLRTRSSQQRNVVIHPEFVGGKYALYTRPQDGFIDAGSGGGIGWGLCEDIADAAVTDEPIMNPRVYHTIKETKNGLGPTPLKTIDGWLHLAHGVRTTAAGLRYVLYAFLADLDDPSTVTYEPGGHLLGPWRAERIGDTSNVLFSNGWVLLPSGRLLIYYASSDTRMHVAETTLDRMLHYVKNTPPDAFDTHGAVRQRIGRDVGCPVDPHRGQDP
jgi:4-O-beta-D-mannosyl-D-glucose phosphorylase